ncbi:MAG: 3-phosphoshikimate 1-carboxyvinyltransferase, partial [Aquificaceae bacterium]
MLKLNRAKTAKGELRVPSDKSISHRAVILSALAEGESYIREWLPSEDTKATLKIVQSLGVEVKRRGRNLRVVGKNFHFCEPADVLDARNSGTTARLMMGMLSTQPFFSVITGDESLRGRPMLRVVEPLRQMGAFLDGRESGNRLPVCIRGGQLRGISFFNKKASAQVKSALLLAGLRAEGYTEVVEPVLSRDHTERMLRAFGVEVLQMEGEKGHVAKLKGGQKLTATEVFCPSDPSSASFFVAFGTLLEGSELLLKDVLVNPTRDGFFRKLRQMGADIRYENMREISGEPIADVYVQYRGRLRGTHVSAEEVPSMTDELPILAVVMALAEGRSSVRGA